MEKKKKREFNFAREPKAFLAFSLSVPSLLYLGGSQANGSQRMKRILLLFDVMNLKHLDRLL